MKPSEAALKAAQLFDAGEVPNCCFALARVQDGLARRFQHEFAERVFIQYEGGIYDLSATELYQFRVFLLLFFAEWLKDMDE